MRLYLPTGVALLLLAAGCASHEGHTEGSHADLPPAPPLLTTSPAQGLSQPTELKDSNPDPAIVEVELTAAPAQHAFLPGKPAAVWAYNGTLPGPTLRARFGDKVIAHFHNQLPEATTIHWHGMRVPADMDGMVEVPAGAKYDYQFHENRDDGTPRQPHSTRKYPPGRRYPVLNMAAGVACARYVGIAQAVADAGSSQGLGGQARSS